MAEWKEFPRKGSGIVGTVAANVYCEKALQESQSQDQPGVGTWLCHPALEYRKKGLRPLENSVYYVLQGRQPASTRWSGGPLA